MGRYFIYAILLYALVVVIYLLWERKVKRGKNTARKKGYNLFHPVPERGYNRKKQIYPAPLAATSYHFGNQ